MKKGQILDISEFFSNLTLPVALIIQKFIPATTATTINEVIEEDRGNWAHA